MALSIAYLSVEILFLPDRRRSLVAGVLAASTACTDLVLSGSGSGRPTSSPARPFRSSP